MNLLSNNAKNPICLKERLKKKKKIFLKLYENPQAEKKQKRFYSKIIRQINSAVEMGTINPTTKLYEIMKHEIHLKPQQYETEFKLYWQSGIKKGERIKSRLPEMNRLIRLKGFGVVPLSKKGATLKHFLSDDHVFKEASYELEEKGYPIN